MVVAFELLCGHVGRGPVPHTSGQDVQELRVTAEATSQPNGPGGHLAGPFGLTGQGQGAAQAAETAYVKRVLVLEAALGQRRRQKISGPNADQPGHRGGIFIADGGSKAGGPGGDPVEPFIDVAGTGEVVRPHVVGCRHEQQLRARRWIALGQLGGPLEPHGGILERQAPLGQPARFTAVAVSALMETQHVRSQVVVGQQRHEKGVGGLALEGLGRTGVQKHAPRCGHAVQDGLPG